MWHFLFGFFHILQYFQGSTMLQHVSVLPFYSQIIFHCIAWLCYIFFFRSSVYICWDCFYFLTVMNSFLQSGTAGSYSVSINLLRNYWTFFQSAHTILHSYQQYMRVLISLHPCQPSKETPYPLAVTFVIV